MRLYVYAGNVFKITICDLKRSKFMVRRQGRKQQDLAKVPPNDVEPSILTLRGRKILLD